MAESITTTHGQLKYEWIHETDRYPCEQRAINIWDFRVDENHRGQGEGSVLLNRILETAREEYAEFVLVNMGGGKDAVQFLENRGFTILSDDFDPEAPLEEQHVDGYKEIYPSEWDGFPEDVPEEYISEWDGWSGGVWD